MTDTLARALEPANEGIDRRKLLKMGVWAAPVVVLATAAPAAASSPELTVTAVPTWAAGDAAGHKTLKVSTKLTVNRAATLIVVLQMAATGSWDDGTTGQTVTKTVPLLTGTTDVTFPLFTRSSSGSNKTLATLTYSVDSKSVHDGQQTSW